MLEKGLTVEIRGKKLFLAFTTATLAEIVNKFGGVGEMLSAFMGPASDPGDTDEIKAEKKIARKNAQYTNLKETPWLIALLANEGAYLLAEDGKAQELVTPDWVARMPSPQFNAMHDEAVRAIAIGLEMEHVTEQEGKATDAYLQEIEAKNAVGAGV